MKHILFLILITGLFASCGKEEYSDNIGYTGISSPPNYQDAFQGDYIVNCSYAGILTFYRPAYTLTVSPTTYKGVMSIGPLYTSETSNYYTIPYHGDLIINENGRFIVLGDHTSSSIQISNVSGSIVGKKIDFTYQGSIYQCHCIGTK